MRYISHGRVLKISFGKRRGSLTKKKTSSMTGWSFGQSHSVQGGGQIFFFPSQPVEPAGNSKTLPIGARGDTWRASPRCGELRCAALCRSVERLTKASQTKRKPASAVFSSSLNGQTSTSLFLFQWAENESDGSLPRWICENSDLKISTSWDRENTFSGSDNWPLYHLFTGVLV